MAESEKPRNPRSSLRKEFREFSFPNESPAPQTPAELKPEDLKFEPYTGARRIPVQGGDDEPTEIPVNGKPEWSLEYEEEQRRIQEAAYQFLPRSAEVQNAIGLSDGLDLVGVIAGGVLEEHYRGVLEDEEVDSYIAAALLLDAQNFDQISRNFDFTTVGIVDEIRMAEDEKIFEDMLENVTSLEPESKRVYLALQIAQLEAVQQELRAGGEPPDVEYHDDIAEMIAAAVSQGDVDGGLVRRAVNLYNEVGVASNYLTTLRMNPDNTVEVLESPGLVAEKPKKPQPPKKSPGGAKPR